MSTLVRYTNRHTKRKEAMNKENLQIFSLRMHLEIYTHLHLIFPCPLVLN